LSVPGTKHCPGFIAQTDSRRAALVWNAVLSNAASPLAIFPSGPEFSAITRMIDWRARMASSGFACARATSGRTTAAATTRSFRHP
jgi:hypothetical protein